MWWTFIEDFCVLDADFTVTGLICKNKCGIDGIFNGRNWCYTNLNSWDYCTPYHYGNIRVNCLSYVLVKKKRKSYIRI